MPQPRVHIPTAALPVVAREIQRHATRRGLLLSAVRTQAAIDERVFAAILRGLLVPDAQTLQRLAKTLRVEPDELLYSDGEIDAGTEHALSLRDVIGELLDDAEIDVWSALVATILRLPPAVRERVRLAILDEVSR